MNESRFDVLIKALKRKCKVEGSRVNAVSVASKLLEISNAMRHVNQELEACKLVIFENLKHHESMMIILGRLESGKDKLAAFSEFQDFEEDIEPQMEEIEAVHDAFLENFDEDFIEEEEDRQNEAERARLLREIIKEIIEVRDDAVAELSTVEQGLDFLQTNLDDMMRRIMFRKKENDALHKYLNQKLNTLLHQSHEAVKKFHELVQAELLNDARSGT